MKTQSLFAMTVFVLHFLFVSCEKNKMDDGTFEQEETGVEINGIIWATRNVGSPNTFVIGSEDYGNYYTWDEAKNVCPTDWRLPNGEELRILYDAGSEWKTINGVNGRIFGSGDNTIFLPAAGKYWYGEHVECKLSGSYWSSSPIEGWAFNLYFSESNASSYAGVRNDRQSVRCVKEK